MALGRHIPTASISAYWSSWLFVVASLDFLKVGAILVHTEDEALSRTEEDRDPKQLLRPPSLPDVYDDADATHTQTAAQRGVAAVVAASNGLNRSLNNEARSLLEGHTSAAENTLGITSAAAGSSEAHVNLVQTSLSAGAAAGGSQAVKMLLANAAAANADVQEEVRAETAKAVAAKAIVGRAETANAEAAKAVAANAVAASAATGNAAAASTRIEAAAAAAGAAAGQQAQGTKVAGKEKNPLTDGIQRGAQRLQTEAAAASVTAKETVANVKRHAAGMQASAIGGAMIANLQNLAPDHLCTFMTLSSMTPPVTAFKMGGLWGFTHCIGTSVTFIALQVVRTWFDVDTEVLEYWGNYLIGLLLMSVSVYFFMKEGDFVVEEKNGEVTVHACKCHSGPAKPRIFGGASSSSSSAPEPDRYTPPVRYSRRQKGPSFASAAFNEGAAAECRREREVMPPPPALPAETEAAGGVESFFRRIPDCQHEESMLAAGTILGLLQGLLCPTALVALHFVLYVKTPDTTAVFLLSYVAMAVISGAVTTWLWSRLVQTGFAKLMSPRTIYRTSCAMLIIFGVCWMIANHEGKLESAGL